MTKLRQKQRARKRMLEQRQFGPMVVAAPSQDRRHDMLAERGARLSMLVGREQRCIDDLQRALDIDPDDFRSRLTMAFVMLRQGRYAEAWPHYSRAMTEPGRDAPAWLGEPLDGRSIAIRFDRELGLGDWIFGCRYVRPLMERAARLVLEVPAKFRSMEFNWPDVFHEGEPVPETDWEVSSLFIPPAMGTTIETIPPCPYVTAPPDLVEQWRQRLRPDVETLVAIAWSGGGSETVRRFRSVPTEEIEKVLAVPGVRFVSVERGLPAEEVARLASKYDFVHVADVVEDDSARSPRS